MDLCERATQRVEARVSRHWWYQERIDLKAAKERTAEAIATDSELASDLESEAEVETELEVGEEERSAYSGVSGSSGSERSDNPWEMKVHTYGTLRKFTT